MISEQEIIDLFILHLAGLTKMANDEEIFIKSCSFTPSVITVEFPTNSPSHAIIRSYRRESGVMWMYEERKDNKINGRLIARGFNNHIYIDKIYKDGVHVASNLPGNKMEWNKPLLMEVLNES